MTKWVSCSVTAVVLLITVVNGYAKGIFVTPGARANGFGAAFYAIADDPSAIYWNPAGLTQLEKHGVEISGWYEANNAKSNRSLTNSVVPDVSSGDFPFLKVYDPVYVGSLPASAEPSEYSKKQLETSALFPFIAGYGKLKEYTIAAGYYVLGGGGGKWNDTVSDVFTGTDRITASLEATNKVITVANVSAARKLDEKLAVGIGLDWITMSDNMEVKKDYVRGAGTALPFDYSMYRKDEDSGSGLQVNAGAQYAFRNNLKAGLVFRSGTALTLKGTAKFTQTGLAAFGLPASLNSDYDKHYNYPMTYGIGIAYDPSRKWTVAFGIEENMYSVLRNNISYSTESVPVGYISTNDSANWKDTTQVRIGTEYRANEKLSLYGGVQTDPTPYSRDKLTLLDTNQYDFTYVTVGAGYDFGAGFKGTAIYVLGVSEKLEKDGTTYEFPMDMFRLSIGYTF